MSSVPEAPGTAPDFSEAYQKARKSYGLFSALLMAWELIGIEIPEVPLENVKITLKSPQAIPYVLVVLVLYFGFRFTLEWLQAHPERRVNKAARIDYLAAHAIGSAAIGIYVLQALFKFQVVDKFPGILLIIAWLSFIAGFTGVTMVDMFRTKGDWLLSATKYLVLLSVLLFVAALGLSVFVSGEQWVIGAILAVAMILIGVVVGLRFDTIATSVGGVIREWKRE